MVEEAKRHLADPFVKWVLGVTGTLVSLGIVALVSINLVTSNAITRLETKFEIVGPAVESMRAEIKALTGNFQGLTTDVRLLDQRLGNHERETADRRKPRD